MNRLIIICLVGAAFLGSGAMGDSQQKTWKGMLAAKPARDTLSIDAKRIALTGFRECTVIVEGFSDKDSLTVPDIEGWTANRLKKIGIRVVTEEEQRKAFLAADQSTDEKALEAVDRFRSQVHVSLNALKQPSGAICLNLTVKCTRGVFVQPGYFRNTTVWDTGRLIYFGSVADVKEKIRKPLDELLDQLERDWKTCNP